MGVSPYYLTDPSSTRYSCIPHRQFWEPLITMPVSTKQGLEKQKASGDLDPKSKNHRLLSWNISSHQGFYQDDATILSGTNLWNIMTPQVWSAVRARVVGWQSFQAKGERCNYFDFICAISLSHVAQKGHCGTIPEDNSTQFPPDSESQDPVARCYKFFIVFCSLLTALLTTTVFSCQVAPQNCGSSARRKISKGRIFSTASRAAWVSILRC